MKIIIDNRTQFSVYAVFSIVKDCLHMLETNDSKEKICIYSGIALKIKLHVNKDSYRFEVDYNKRPVITSDNQVYRGIPYE